MSNKRISWLPNPKLINEYPIACLVRESLDGLRYSYTHDLEPWQELI